MMKVCTFTKAILEKISDISNCRRKFILHIVSLYLSMRGRRTYLTMARYGSYCEKSYRRHFSEDVDFKAFNRELISRSCGSELVWIFDPSYISKSGKRTPGVGYFWSGCAGAMKWGLELSSLAVADVENHAAMHYHATRTQVLKEKESLRNHYGKLICEQARELHKISKVMTFDAFFSKKPFVDRICEAGFTLVSRLQKNIFLRYAYGGAQQAKGRRKVFDGSIDLKNVSADHFQIMEQDDEKVVYEGKAHVRCLKRWCKVVILNTLKAGKAHKAFVYFSTDPDMPGRKVREYYSMRYQIEFLFRDAKGCLGLEDTQSRQEKALDFHFNLSLTTLNIAKATHWLATPKEQRGPFSMADICTQYINELVLDRLILIYGKDPKIEKMNPKIQKLYQLGRIAA